MDEKLNNYFFGSLSEKEKEKLFSDLDKDDVLRKEFADQRNLLSVLMMHEKKEDNSYAQEKYHLFKRKINTLLIRKIVLQVTKYAAIIVLAIGLWSIYRNETQNKLGNVTYTHIEVPAGQRVHIFLPDGTGVWLNAKTKLSYPSDYSARNRNVQLEGEGYFEVTSDKKHPFVVHSSLMKVNVLGTKFNVRSYQNEASLVTLIEGTVEVLTSDEMNKLTLKPNEQASISETRGITLSEKKGIENVSSWTIGEFYYLNEPLISIARDIERRFNVNVMVLDETLKNEIFTYHPNENATLEQILRHLKGTKELNYTIENDQIKLFKP